MGGFLSPLILCIYMNIIVNNLSERIELCRQILVTHFYEKYITDDEFKKDTRDQYYHCVYYSGLKNSGYVSNDVFKNEGSSTDDHYLSPRLMISAIIENHTQTLFDKDAFSEYFELCREVVKVTKNQNNAVKFVNKDNKILINELTINKYDKFSPWWEIDTLGNKKKVMSHHKEFPLKHKIPEWFTEHEKKFLIKG